MPIIDNVFALLKRSNTWSGERNIFNHHGNKQIVLRLHETFSEIEGNNTALDIDVDLSLYLRAGTENIRIFTNGSAFGSADLESLKGAGTLNVINGYFKNGYQLAPVVARGSISYSGGTPVLTTGSMGISSISDQGTGKVRTTFSATLTNDYYSGLGCVTGTGEKYCLTDLKTTNYAQFYTRDSVGGADVDFNFIVVGGV
jgi:hypothetical protein